MSGISKCIRLIVKTTTDKRIEGETCLVDTSKGLHHVLHQVSQQIDCEVSRLSLVVFHQGCFVTNATINAARFLKDKDVVLAIRRKETATSLIAEAASKVAADASQKKPPPAAARAPLSETASSTGEIGSHDDCVNDNGVNGAPPKKKAGPPKHKVGTKVRKNFVDHGWFDGEIIEVNMQRHSYIVKYSDGDEEEYWMDTPLIDKLVKEAKKKKRGCPSNASHERKRKRSSVGGSLSKRQRILQQTSLMCEQRKQLSDKKFDIEEFRRYLIEEEELKHSDKIVRKVETFTQNGFKYKYWQMDVVFHPDPITHLDEDFSKMIKDAEKHEETHGYVQDDGLKKILQKLENFQKHCWNKLEKKRQDEAVAAEAEQQQQQLCNEQQQQQQDDVVPDSVAS